MELSLLLSWVQLFFLVVIGLYFLSLLRTQHGGRVAVNRESRHEMEKLEKMRAVALSPPLTELTRPASFAEVVGQEDGLRALRAALCGPNPQHVIVYGPPGVGKTAAARLVLEEAKRNPSSPFGPGARFVEVDATASRFDERGIADPLIGSVHDPIYQGAGPLGIAGIPQPKPGAVTRAHGGILFLDEIGELHPVQLNRLLKVLEDRRVHFESAYYSPEDPNIPRHIRDIFENGLPADFRLVGATTRSPEEISPAIRSRCMEVFFRPLEAKEVWRIAANAAARVGFALDDDALEVVGRYAGNGRDAVSMVQTAIGVAQGEGRRRITRADLEWVVTTGQYSPRLEVRPAAAARVGVAYGLGVAGPNVGVVMEVEASCRHVGGRGGQVRVTGAVEEEEVGVPGRRLRRKGQALGAVETVLSALTEILETDLRDYDLHVSWPGGIPVDGPSGGAALGVAVASALLGKPVRPTVALTGEVSIRGEVKSVGGIVPKVAAARRAGFTVVLIPADNRHEGLAGDGLEVRGIEHLAEALSLALLEAEQPASPAPPVLPRAIPAG
ncbi:MAG: ATP-dependent protease LonB [Bacillota bacterium]|nr:ATP-dependent protease LonB [Bacillota bacterium]